MPFMGPTMPYIHRITRSWSSGYDRRLPSDGPGFNSRRTQLSLNTPYNLFTNKPISELKAKRRRKAREQRVVTMTMCAARAWQSVISPRSARVLSAQPPPLRLSTHHNPSQRAALTCLRCSCFPATGWEAVGDHGLRVHGTARTGIACPRRSGTLTSRRVRH